MVESDGSVDEPNDDIAPAAAQRHEVRQPDQLKRVHVELCQSRMRVVITGFDRALASAPV